MSLVSTIGRQAHQRLVQLRARHAYREAVAAWAHEQHPYAQSRFREAVRLDPTCADALLGLLFYRPSDLELSEALYEQRAHVGRLQGREQERVHGHFRPLGGLELDIVDESDAVLAYASALAREGRRDEVDELLLTHGLASGPVGSAIRAYVAISLGHAERACTLLGVVLKTPGPLQAEAMLRRGEMRVAAGDESGALGDLQVAESHGSLWIARRATHLLTQMERAQTAAPPSAWEELSAMLECGPLADHPDISDNQ